MIIIKHKIQKILVIEDSQMDYILIIHWLKNKMFSDFIDANVHFIQAETIEEAAAYLLTDHYDLITLDGNINNNTTEDLFPLFDTLDFYHKILMLTGSSEAWEQLCRKNNITLLDKNKMTNTTEELFAFAT